MMNDVAEEIARKQYHCPFCEEALDLPDLQLRWGLGGGSYCPKCQQQVYLSSPYSKRIAVLSLLLVVALLWILQVTSIFWFVAGTVALWVPISLLLNAYSTGFTSSTLKKRKPRIRTFFEWLYDREKPPEIFGKDKRNN
jgi:uncharacterized paraquat-inducible protein A